MIKNAKASPYQRPGAVVDRMIDAQSFSIPVFNHQRTAVIKRYAEDMPSIDYVSRSQIKLGGDRFNGQNYTAISNFYLTRLVYLDLATGREKEISFPEGSVLRETLWSLDGKHLAVSLEKKDSQEVWIVKIPSMQKTKIKNLSLSAALGRTIEWVNDQELLLAARTKAQSAPLSVPRTVPEGPVIQDSAGVVSQNRTYPDLIKSESDQKTYAQAVSAQLVIYQLNDQRIKNLGKPVLLSGARLSPNRKLLLIQTFVLPFSQIVPSQLFAKRTEVWDLKGKVIHAFPVKGPFENLPIQGVPVGPRSVQWIESEAQTLFYAEALDQGDWAVKAEFRDELFRLKLSAKEAEKPERLIRLKNRYAGFQAMSEAGWYWITEYERDKQWVSVQWLKQKKDQSFESEILFSLNENDAYADPGEPVSQRNSFGRMSIAIDRNNAEGPSVYLSGAGASPEGDLPFLSKFNLQTKKTQTLFRSEKGTFERFVGFKDDRFQEFITAFESVKISPQYRMRDLKTGEVKTIIADPNPYAELGKIKKEVITYSRADGVKLSGILYYPLDYQKGKKYPAIIQAYPLEYTDASTAGQVRGSSSRFSVPYHEDMIYNALRGYFVLDEAQMPIVGHPETKNDTFIEQLVSSAKAAVDTLDERGLVDRKRIGIIGHSYGAYMVANLLTHSDLFATGIAKSGAYNRTLTPFGFQGERRPLWRAKDTYLKMSPFLYADEMKKPILLIHGMADNNTGTFTLQSERYFDALKGQGATARLVLLPDESHGYAAKESVKHVLSEIFTWFDRYLKEAPKPQ